MATLKLVFFENTKEKRLDIDDLIVWMQGLTAHVALLFPDGRLLQIEYPRVRWGSPAEFEGRQQLVLYKEVTDEQLAACLATATAMIGQQYDVSKIAFLAGRNRFPIIFRLFGWALRPLLVQDGKEWICVDGCAHVLRRGLGEKYPKDQMVTSFVFRAMSQGWDEEFCSLGMTGKLAGMLRSANVA